MDCKLCKNLSFDLGRGIFECPIVNSYCHRENNPSGDEWLTAPIVPDENVDKCPGISPYTFANNNRKVENV